MVAATTVRGEKTRKPAATEMVHVRVSDSLKRDATKTLEKIGITLPDAVRHFMHRVVVEQGLPLRIDVPNAETRAAIESSRKVRPGRYASPQDMFDALEKAGEL